MKELRVYLAWLSSFCLICSPLGLDGCSRGKTASGGQQAAAGDQNTSPPPPRDLPSKTVPKSRRRASNSRSNCRMSTSVLPALTSCLRPSRFILTRYLQWFCKRRSIRSK